VGKDLLLEEIKSTFVALIPMKDVLKSYGYFTPIFLCNDVYKIISKVIVGRLKPIMSLAISSEQFGFLDGIQMHEAISIAQEGFCTILR
jgi:hypothetical protein